MCSIILLRALLHITLCTCGYVQCSECSVKIFFVVSVIVVVCVAVTMAGRKV